MAKFEKGDTVTVRCEVTKVLDGGLVVAAGSGYAGHDLGPVCRPHPEGSEGHRVQDPEGLQAA